MGRNSIPKLGEWRDGHLYRFRCHDGSIPTADNGKLVVYERIIAPLSHGGEEVTEVLATAYADGLQELMSSMFRDGYQKGLREGRKKAKEEVRKALLGD